MPDLKSRLVRSAEAWVAAQADDAPLSRLGKRVMDDARFFTRLDDSRSGPTTSTLERFARFLIEPDNWPAGQIPAEVCGFCHAVGISGPACAAPVTIPHPAEPEHALLREPSGRTPPAPCDSPAGGTGQPAVAASPALESPAAAAGTACAGAAR